MIIPFKTNETINAVGSVSASSLVYDGTNNSSQWNSTFTTVKSNSGSWSTSTSTSTSTLTSSLSSYVFTANGSTTLFNLSTTQPLTNPAAYIVAMNGVVQTPNNDYNITYNTTNYLNLLFTPRNGATITVENIGNGTISNANNPSGTFNVGVINATGNSSFGGIINSTYTGAADSSLTFTGVNNKGGGGAGNYYNDFVRAIGGNGVNSMYFRTNYSGGVELVNSPYNATTLTVSQSGMIGILQNTVQTNNIPSNNAIAFNGHSYIQDDGNMHITARDGTIWINTNSSSDVVLNGQNSTGGVQAFGTFKMNSGYGSVATTYGVRAWINFSVSGGTITTNGSGNLSVSRSGTGTYVFTFGTAMPDANYCITATAQTPVANSDLACNIAYNVAPSTTGFTLQTARYGTGNVDASLVCVQVVR